MFVHKIITAAAVAVLGSAGLAVAQPATHAGDVTSIRVSAAGINVHGQAGAQQMRTRIRSAAETICGDKPDARELDRSALYGACVTETVSKAVHMSRMPGLELVNGGGIVEASR